MPFGFFALDEVGRVDIRDAHGEIVACLEISTDITERKRAEEKVLRYQEQLRALASELSRAEELDGLLFQATRELLTNVVKHARATASRVDVKSDGTNVIVCVEDNGGGFDAATAERTPGDVGGFGLFSIRERLSHFGGRVEIESGQEHATRVSLIVPVGEADHSGDA